MRRSHVCGLAVVGLLSGANLSGWAQSIANPSFEADTFTNFPGYVSVNAPITGWTGNPAGRVGLNPSTNSPFADNGAIPDGVKVAFIQSAGEFSTLSNNITGLLPGHTYVVSFRANRRSTHNAPSPSWSLNGGVFQPFTATPAVGGANPYYTIRTAFVATASSAPLVIANQTGSDSTVLLDAFTVTALIVTNATDGAISSLRRVLASVPTGLPPVRITFGANLAGANLVLTNQLIVTNHYILDGSTLSAGVTIDGGPGTHRLFTFNAGTTNTLIGLNLTGGNGSGGDGGAIRNSGVLSLIGCAIFSNAANSAVGLGGAINNSGTLSVSNSTFSANSAYWGGAVYGAGTFVHCTVAGNSATGSPSAFGGGLYGATVVENSIVAGNAGSGGADVYISGGVTFAGTNIIQDFGGGASSGTTPLNVNPLLNGLANYGGLTRTRSLQTNSPARDGAGGSTTATDQRGYPRPSGAAADIGAVEIQSPFVVTNIADTGNGTLRSTILAVARGSNDSSLITFTPGLAGQTITLTNEIVIAGHTAISATNLPDGMTVDGGPGSNRIFSVSAGVTAALHRLTLKGGGADGATSSGFGGAIYNEGHLRIHQSTITSNSALFYGGAILCFSGTLEMDSCAVFGNTATTAAGGIAVWNSTATLTNCTISGNAAGFGGGLFVQSSPQTLTHCTVSSNSASDGGGIYNAAGATLILNDSIVAGNEAASASDVQNFSTVTVIGANLVQGLANSGTGLVNGSGSLVAAGPQLAPLGDYGGPTPIMALLPGSPAIDGAAGSSATTDQRGVARPYGAAPDIGAFEFDTATVWTNTDSGAGSLRYAVQYATNGAAIAFEPSMLGQTITLASEIQVFRTAVISATNLPGSLTVSGNDSSRIFLAVDSTKHLTLEGLNIVSGRVVGADAVMDGGNAPPAYGGAIVAAGPLTLIDCAFEGNAVIGGSGATSSGGLGGSGGTAYGGAVLCYDTLEVRDCDFRNNRAVGGSGGDGLTQGGNGGLAFGGSIHSADVFSISNSIFQENRAVAGLASPTPTSGTNGFSAGGAISWNVNLSASAIADSTFERNEAVIAGALRWAGVLSIDRSVFRENVSSNAVIGWGGAIQNIGRMQMTDSLMISNVSALGGGIINESMGTVTLVRTTVAYNRALRSNGGGIQNAGLLFLESSTLVGNTTVNEGGGLRCTSSGVAYLTNCTVVGNSALTNGGGISKSTQILGLFATIVADNTAPASNNIAGAILDQGFNLTNDLALLAPLGDYGGPTLTMALLPGSPARNAATGSTVTADQRGFAIVGIPDIGAYEAGSVSNYNAWIWETLLPTNADHAAGADADGDFVSNENEWGALTDPGSGSNFLRALTIGGTNLTFPSVLNRTYRLQQADTVTGPWSNSVAAPIAGDGAVKSFAIPAVTTQQYFRVEAGP